VHDKNVINTNTDFYRRKNVRSRQIISANVTTIFYYYYFNKINYRYYSVTVLHIVPLILSLPLTDDNNFRYNYYFRSNKIITVGRTG